MKKYLIAGILILIIFSTISNVFAQNVIATQKGPSQAYKGENITIEYVVTNNGNQAIYQVSVTDQNFFKFLGTINPGESKKFTEKVYIPTDKEIQIDFDPEATVSNPFFIGSVGVNYQDENGQQYTINSNSLSIPLKELKDNKSSDESINGSSPSETGNRGIWQEILDFINSIIAYFKALFNIS
ncbi:MAG: hypothetical protein ACP5C3_02525 [Methanomicrobiales archaeon]